MNDYPDYRLRDEEEIYDFYRGIDYSKVYDWKVLFKTHSGYVKALVDMDHPFHKEARQIRDNRSKRSNLVITSIDENGDIHMNPIL
jgi:hypothetical protein